MNRSDTDPVGQSTSSGLALSLYELLATQGKRAPDAIAIAAPGRKSLTYGRLLRHIDMTAKQLNALGIGWHDRVAVVLPNGPEMAVAFLAVACGATSAPLNPAYRAHEFDFYLSDLHASALMIQAGIDSPAIAMAQKHGIAIIECVPQCDAEAGIFKLESSDCTRPRGVGHAACRSGFAPCDEVALALHTSGTTSRPKLVPLTHRNICTSAWNIQQAVHLTEADCCLNIMPLFHIHGLIGALLSSLMAGGSVVCTAGFDVTAFFPWLEACHPTWYTAVPTMHHAILSRAERQTALIARHPLRFIRSSSAPLPPPVMAGLEQIFQAPVIESYGMTEASHQMASNPLPPRNRKAGSVGVPAGPEIAILDERGCPLPAGHKGEIGIRGANVTQGYETNSTANQGAFINGWFRTGDQGFFDTEGYLFITGRLKELINRGGEKISPREIDDVLIEHPAIAQVVTFAAPDVLLGEEIVAAVVLKEEVTATERDIQAFAATRLADFKVPRRVVLVSEIPQGPSGKLQRAGLAELLGLAHLEPTSPAQKRTFVGPRDKLEVQLTQIWEEVLAISPIGITDSFFALGGHSLLAVRLFAEIERVTGHNLPLATLFQALTVEELAELLRQEGGAALWSPLVPIQARGSRSPFFFIHAVSGNVLNYRFLSQHLGTDQPLYGLQAQGLDGQQAPHTRIEDMAALYIKEMRILQPEGPYFLGGGSSGGVVAFEMAQRLSAQGQRVALLAMFDTYFPGDLRFLPTPSIIHAKTPHLLQKVDRHLGHLLLLRPREQFSYLLGTVGRIKLGFGTKAWRNVDNVHSHSEGSLSRALQVVLEANRHALSHYVPHVYPGRITLFLSTEAPERTCYDRRLGWHESAAEGLEVHLVPGNHDNLFEEPHVGVLAEKLKMCLQRVQGAPPQSASLV
jgi:acyl-CoA synthetase (AMP-forming)/AMP-acid ligase II/thioesterase domain-containing protein/acyl carrier protein